MKAWTDYPIEELGDAPNRQAPIRECTVLTYDRNKYCWAQVTACGSALQVEVLVKAGYLYQQPGRCGEVPAVPLEHLLALPEWPEPTEGFEV